MSDSFTTRQSASTTARAVKPLDFPVVPRPPDEIYLKYSTEVFEKGMKPDQTLSPLETNVANTLVEYLQGLAEQGLGPAGGRWRVRPEVRGNGWTTIRPGFPWVSSSRATSRSCRAQGFRLNRLWRSARAIETSKTRSARRPAMPPRPSRSP